jgi:hypothetical protein
MIAILTINRILAGQFEDFNELFDSITTNVNLEQDTTDFDVNQMDWSFIIHPPQQVGALYIHSKNPSEAMKEAFEEHLSLIEICAGDYKHPVHIALTPNVDMDYLKKKWCMDWCTWHHLVVREMC